MTGTLRAIVLATCAALCGSIATAAGSGVELTPFVGLRSGTSFETSSTAGGDVEADPALSFGLGVDVPLRVDARLEFFYDRQELELEDDGTTSLPRFDLTVEYLQVGATYEPPGPGVRGFVAAGLGLTRFDADGARADSTLGLGGSIGGGVKVPMSERLTLRLELRGYGTLSDLELQATCGPGCSVQLHGGGAWQFAARAGLAIRLR